MKKIALITPISFLGTEITKLLVWINRYDLGSNSAYVHWMLTSDNTQENMKDGDIVLSGEVIETWGTDDTPIFQAIADQVGVTITEIVDGESPQNAEEEVQVVEEEATQEQPED